MTFANRFDLLMRLSNTSNNTIARFLAMDPSYISRLRRGERNRPRHRDYIVSICTFFARQLLNGGGLQNFAESVADPAAASIQDPKELEAYLERWILTDSQNGVEVRDGIRTQEVSSPASIVPYYGITGRYQAMLTLLSSAKESLPTFTLLMYSDESAEFPENQRDLHSQWNQLLQESIQLGNRVKIILKTSRNIDEMFNSISYWLPLYASGNVDAYYYPRLRDGVYKRVLYVIPGFAAVFSSAIGTFGENVSTFFVSDPITVDSFSDEFYSYLSLCEPLMEPVCTISTLSNAPTLPFVLSFRQDWLTQAAAVLPLLSALVEKRESPVTLLLYTQDAASLEQALASESPPSPEALAHCRQFLNWALSLTEMQEDVSLVFSDLHLSCHTCMACESDWAVLAKNNHLKEGLLIRENHVTSTIWEIFSRALETAPPKYAHPDWITRHLQTLLDHMV